MMKKLLQGALLPFAIFAAGISLIGCDQATDENHASPDTSNAQEKITTQTDEGSSELKSGNMLYVVSDVADLQLKAGDYVQQLKQTQADLEHALQAQDPESVQTAVNALRQQLTDFNRALDSLNLKSQEIESIREKIRSSNQQILELPYLNGQLDMTAAELKKIEQQLSLVQSEMLTLAKMLLLKPESTEN